MKRIVSILLIAACGPSVQPPGPGSESGPAPSPTAPTSEGATSVLDTGSETSAGTTGACVPTEPYEPHYACGTPGLGTCAGLGIPVCADGKAGPLATCTDPSVVENCMPLAI